jgi:hypothetical protein
MNTITLAQLREAKACESQVKLFEQVFGDSVSFDNENFFVPYAQKFDFAWGARNLLSAPARKTSYEQYDLAEKTFDKQIDLAEKTYDEQTALARKTFDEQYALAWKTYREQIAILFTRAYLSMEV